MSFAVGDQVVHRAHGLGRITRMDHVQAQDGRRECYVVDVGHGLIVWVPIDGVSEQCLRSPLSSTTITALSDILRSPAQPLERSSRQRVQQLRDRMREGSPNMLCALVRDLTSYASLRVPSSNDTAVLDKARSMLVAEWALATDMPDAAAQVSALLRESSSANDKPAGA
jgi:CarD family transcriptional regulator